MEAANDGCRCGYLAGCVGRRKKEDEERLSCGVGLFEELNLRFQLGLAII